MINKTVSRVDALRGLIPDSEVERVHANARFGVPPRDVIDEGVAICARKTSLRHAQLLILKEHGLLSKTNGYRASLSKKGRAYLRFSDPDLYEEVFLKKRA